MQALITLEPMGRQFALIFLFTGDTGHLLRQPYQLHLESVCVSANGVGGPWGRYPEDLSAGLASDAGDIAFDVADIFAQISVPPGLLDHIIVTAFTAAFAMRRFRPLLTIVFQFHVHDLLAFDEGDRRYAPRFDDTDDLGDELIQGPSMMTHLSEDVSTFATGYPLFFRKRLIMTHDHQK